MPKCIAADDQPDRRPNPCCDVPVTSVIDDLSLHDESASIVIVGGGPHALAALAALHEGSLAFSQFGDDNAFQARVGFGTLEKVGSVIVVDPGSHFMQSWNARFSALEIGNLRSPAFAHCVPHEPTALLNFAIKEGRTSELRDTPFVTKWLATTDFSQQDPLLKALPSQALFRDFCASLEAKLPHRWLSGSATGVCKDAVSGKFHVHYRATADRREHKVIARAVILATGPVGKWKVPAPFEPHLASPLVLHTEELLVESKGTLSKQIARRCPGESARVLVIGGGISAAQAALAAFHAGHQVVLRSRRPLQTRAFDIAAEWLDLRYSNRLRFEFWSLPMEERLQAVRQATSGGSVPARYMDELHKLAEASSRMVLEVDEALEGSVVAEGGGGGAPQLVVNGQPFGMVILATGVSSAPLAAPLYRSVQQQFGAPVVDGLPRVDEFLRWVADEDLFVLGANAVLELGPGGGNLMGAMRGAKVVANELHALMWQQSEKAKKAKIKTRRIYSNQFAALMGDGSEAESGDGSEAESGDGSEAESGASSDEASSEAEEEEEACAAPPCSADGKACALPATA